MFTHLSKIESSYETNGPAKGPLRGDFYIRKLENFIDDFVYPFILTIVLFFIIIVGILISFDYVLAQINIAEENIDLQNNYETVLDELNTINFYQDFSMQNTGDYVRLKPYTIQGITFEVHHYERPNKEKGFVVYISDDNYIQTIATGPKKEILDNVFEIYKYDTATST